MNKSPKKSAELKLVQTRVDPDLAQKLKIQAARNKRSQSKELAFLIHLGVNNPELAKELAYRASI